MEQLQEIGLNNISEPECAKIEICIKCKEYQIELEKEKEVHKVPLKNRLSRLIRKSKYNANYIEQVIPIQRVERKRIHRNYGIW